MSERWDVIVVGARCAGSPAAMLLAQRGYRVLLVDKATFPSDTISTHLIHPPGVAALDRWGLADRLAATGCPAIASYRFDVEGIRFSGSAAIETAPVSYCPRRTVLDKLLVDAASEAGVEVRESFVVDELTREGERVTGLRGRAGGATLTEKASVVVGADGRRSAIAESVGAESYDERPPAQAGYYTYWSGLPTDAVEFYGRGTVGWGVMPTHGGLTLVVVGRQIGEFEGFRHDIEGTYLATVTTVPEFAERIRTASREDRFYGLPVESYFRKPFGPGWALVGDAGYNKDPITAQGISDAFRDAELLASALDRALAGEAPWDEAMAAYQRQRDEHVAPMYNFTYDFSKLEPPPPETVQLLGAVAASPESSDEWARVFAGVLSPAEFFAPDHVGQVFARAQRA